MPAIRTQIATPGDMRRARLYLAAMNIKIIKAAAARRQAHGRGNGARLPAAMGHHPVAVQVLSEGRPGPHGRRITPLGYKTAVRALPPILAGLNATDPRRRAADLLASACERIGSIQGGNLEGAAPKAGVSDGGVTTRIKHASRLRVIKALANGWAVDMRQGPATDGPARVLMPVQRQGRNRQHIKAFPALVMLCVEGLDLAAILRRHGWSAKSDNTKALGLALLSILDDLAGALGLGRWHGKKGVDT